MYLIIRSSTCGPTLRDVKLKPLIPQPDTKGTLSANIIHFTFIFILFYLERLEGNH